MAIKISSSQNSRATRLPQLLQQAVAAHQDGDLDSAAPLYRRFLAANPAHPTALQLLGLLHSQRGEYADAIGYMQESLRQFPQQAEVANNLGNALTRSGRLEEAMEYYTSAVELSPGYADAWKNLGLCHLQQDQLVDAGASLRHCLEIQPGDAAAWLGLGNVYRRRNDVDSAIKCLEQALALKPDYAEAHHNLGVCLRLKQRPADAIEHYRTAHSLGLDRAELHHNLGSALVDTGNINAAIAAYREAVQRDPEDIVSHRNLNTLLWEQELLEEHLRSYRVALDRRPASEQLARSYGIALNQREAYVEAEQVLRQGLRHTPESSELKTILAYTLECRQRWEEALQMHADALASPDSIPEHRVSYARALLACRRPEQALQQVREAAAAMPFNQRALAYLGLCWRLMGDARDAILNDYESFIRVYDVPVPAGFVDANEFNTRLSAVLDTLHTGKRHPPEQTLRGGTQTHGDLLRRCEPEIETLVAGLTQCIQDYIGQLPHHPEHPLLMRRSAYFDYAASWSVRLRRSGYHTMHVHPLGWISAVYYVKVPPEVSSTDTYGGGIKFGEPDIDLGTHGRARRLIQPVPGQLVLFPSYMWHGTVPCESDAPRMTVSFDIVPAHGKAGRDEIFPTQEGGR
jgi:uncharacterized protein (TIGR02466 family)